jgi:hypothetical protein
MLYNNGNNYGARVFDPLVHSTCGTGVGSDEMSFTGTFQATIGADSVADFASKTIFTLRSDAGLPSFQTATSENIADGSNTPEPPTFFLFGSGLTGLGILKRRRRA